MIERSKAQKAISAKKFVQNIDGQAVCRYSIIRGRYVVVTRNAKIIGEGTDAFTAWGAARDHLKKLAAETQRKVA